MCILIILLHDYNLCFNGFPCYTVGYYNYKTRRSEYVAVHLPFYSVLVYRPYYLFYILFLLFF